MTETLDELTGIAKRVVIDWRSGSARGQQDLRPALVIKDKDGKILKLARGGEARYLLAVDAIISVDPGSHVGAGDVIARIPTESAKTRDITGGLPRVAELFEARRPKEFAVIAEISGTVRFGRDYKNKRRISIEPTNKDEEPREYLVAKGKHIHLQDGDVIEKGDFIVEGNPAPHDILAIKGVEELAGYLVNEIQDVYRLQGVAINDKHIEVIVRQMLQKVEIVNSGETDLIQGEQVDKTRVRRGQCPLRGRRQKAGDRASGAARHHQGLAADTLVHLGGIVPGDDAGAHRSRGQRQGRHARRAQGKCHRRPSDPGRDRRHDEQDPRSRHQARRAHPRRAREGSRRQSGSCRRACGTSGGGVTPAQRAIEGRPVGGPFHSVMPTPLKILSGGAMRSLMVDLVPLFERASGEKVEIEFRLTSVLQKEIEDGAVFDIALLPRPEVDALAQAGRIAADATADITRSSVGLAVRAGAPKPDIATVEALKQTLLNAQSIAYSDGPSGAYIAALLERLGIADAMKSKTKLTSRPVAELMASGEAEIGMQQIVAILPVKGAELVAPLPSELQNVIIYAAGLSAAAQNGGAAKACIDFMRGPRSRAPDPCQGHGAGLIGDSSISQMCLRHRAFMPISASRGVDLGR